MTQPMPSIPQLTAKSKDGVLLAVSLGRISTPHQELDSIEASHQADMTFLKQLYAGEIDLRCFGEQGSGWKIDRESIKEAEEFVKTGQPDVVVMADLGRAYRNPAFQFALAHLCKDNGVRLICIRDGIDTAIPGWELQLHIAVLLHGMTVPLTRRRVRDKATFLFYRGSMVLRVRFGYVRLTKEQAATGKFGAKDLRIARDDNATPVIREIRERILRGDNYEDIARWLNDLGVKPGPYVKSGEWTGRVVVSLARSVLLHGRRRFRERLHELIYKTGEHRREKNPNPEEQLVPELAHMTQQEQEELWAAMDTRMDAESRTLDSPLKGRPRKRALFGGQHLRCGVCGKLCYRMSPVFKCRDSRRSVGKKCWCSVQVDPQQLIPKLMPLLIQEVRKRPLVWNQLVDAAVNEIGIDQLRSSRTVRKLSDKVDHLERQCTILINKMLEVPDSPSLTARFNATEAQLKKAQAELKSAKADCKVSGPVLTRQEVETRIEEVAIALAKSSYEFAALLRRLFPDLKVIPVQALDTPQMHPRVQWTLPPHVAGDPPVVITVDAFTPGLHITHALKCKRIKTESPGLTLVQIGQLVGIGKQRVHQALLYAELMAKRDTSDLFIVVTEKPTRASRWRPGPEPKQPAPGDFLGDLGAA